MKKSARKNHSFTQASNTRRVAYSLAAGAAACGVTTDANADILYSGLRDASINQFSWYGVDFDFDASYDLKLKNYVFGAPYQGATILTNYGKLASFKAGLYYVTALSEGAWIGPSTPAPSYFGSMAYGAANPNAQFNNVTDAYLGLSFGPNPSSLRYGWVRVSINNAAGTFTVKDWASQSEIGVGIYAGQVPEPGTLGMLAAGGAGLLALRRRRREAA